MHPQFVQQKADTEVAMLEVNRQMEKRQYTEDRCSKVEGQLQSSQRALETLSCQIEQHEASNRRMTAHMVKLKSQLGKERLQSTVRMRRMQHNLLGVKARLEHCKWRLSLAQEQDASQEAYITFLRGELYPTEERRAFLEEVRTGAWSGTTKQRMWPKELLFHVELFARGCSVEELWFRHLVQCLL
jgi:hypothetical protein